MCPDAYCSDIITHCVGVMLIWFLIKISLVNGKLRWNPVNTLSLKSQCFVMCLNTYLNSYFFTFRKITGFFLRFIAFLLMNSRFYFRFLYYRNCLRNTGKYTNPTVQQQRWSFSEETKKTPLPIKEKDLILIIFDT